MKNTYRCLFRLALAFVVAGCAVQARAAMSVPTEWTDLSGFMSRMVISETGEPQYFDLAPVTWPTGGGNGYNYVVTSPKKNVNLVTFSGSPTGVGGFFAQGTALTFAFSDGSVINSIVTATGFVGYTTDVDPSVLSILSFSFAGSAGKPSRMIAGLDAVTVPEATTLMAGALLLLPFAASTIRGMRKSG